MSTKDQPAFKIPKTHGACADRLYRLRQEKSKLTKKVGDIQAEITALKNHLIDQLPHADSTGVIGKLATVRITQEDIPTPKDWTKIYRYIHRYKSWHLMQRRLSKAAIKELWKDGKKVPGVEIFTKFDVSCTKKR